jgi:hypothetical protein
MRAWQAQSTWTCFSKLEAFCLRHQIQDTSGIHPALVQRVRVSFPENLFDRNEKFSHASSGEAKNVWISVADFLFTYMHGDLL